MTSKGPAEAWRASLTAEWERTWPGVRPDRPELVEAMGSGAIRFHTLPAGKRYATTPRERGEIARRQQTILRELAGPDRSTELRLITSWYASQPQPPPRMPLRRQRLLPSTRQITPAMRAPYPGARWWQSFRADDGDAGWVLWTHLLVEHRRRSDPRVRQLLRRVVDDEISDVIITTRDLRWFVFPYDGGVDVLAATPDRRELVAGRCASWLAPGIVRPD